MGERDVAAHAVADGERLIVRTGKAKVLLTALVLDLVFAWAEVVSLMPARGGGLWETPAVHAFVVIAAPISGLVLSGHALWLAVSPAPALVATRGGVTLKVPFLRRQEIPWREVRALQELRYRLVPFLPGGMLLEVILRDPARVAAYQAPWQRRATRVFRAPLSWGPLVITGRTMATPIPEVVDQIERRFHHELAHYRVDVRRATSS